VSSRRTADNLREIAAGIRGKYIGPDLPDNEHLGQCEVCGQAFDVRDLGDLLYHNLSGPGHKKLPTN
jgi:hypothetical protein